MKNIESINVLELKAFYKNAAKYISSRFSVADFAFTAGSGISGISENFKILDEMDYSEIPDISKSSVHGHAGKLLLLEYSSKKCLFFAGRTHIYDGLGLNATLFNSAICANLGIQKAIFSNAVGGLNPLFKTGDIMIADDLLNLSRYETVNCERGFSRRLIMDNQWRRTILEKLESHGIDYKLGALGFTSGPTYETPAEIRAFRKFGADAIGMSTVLEIKAAHELGIEAIGVSMITNTLKETNTDVLSHADVIEAAKSAEAKLFALLKICFSTL
jgi:purine-nucleoside phosphorylase